MRMFPTWLKSVGKGADRVIFISNMRLMYYLCAEEIQLAHLVEKAPVDIHGGF